MIDLHSHTNISDGVDSPDTLVQVAKSSGISFLAITDHDTVRGWQALTPVDHGSLTVIPGAEISCRTETGMSVHMLGYLFKPDDAQLNEYMAMTRDDRVPRMKKIIELLNEAGIEITFDDVLRHSDGAATLGRPHLADAMVERSLVATRDEAFARYLHNDSPFYVGHLAPTPQEAILTINNAGGVSILAHALAGSRGEVLTLSEMEKLIEGGLDGLEVDHRDHDRQSRVILKDLADAHHLFATGSSDYHGTGGGARLGMEVTSPEVLEGILDQGEGCGVFTV